MKTAISLPDSLFHAADSLARRMGMSRSELFRAAVADYIEAHKHNQVREALDTVYSEQPAATRRGIDADADHVPAKGRLVGGEEKSGGLRYRTHTAQVPVIEDLL